MSVPDSNIGRIGWFDLTVPDAEGIRDFYSAVVGWKFEPLDMGEYADFVMTQPETGTGLAGICHARGQNAALPPSWLMYITVADIDASLAFCAALGGEIIKEPSAMSEFGRFAVIRDPAGAVCALIQPPPAAR